MPTHNKYQINNKYFDKIDSEEKAYWLGFIWADGCVYTRRNGRESGLKITIKDKEHLEKFKNSIDFFGKIYIKKGSGFKPDSLHYTISICDKNIYCSLIKLGRNNGIGIPKIPEKLKRHFLRGYFDGDGSVYNTIKRPTYKGKEYCYNSLNVSIILNVTQLESFTEYLNKKLIKYRIRKSRTDFMKYILIDTKNEVNDFYSLIYKNSTIYLDRKKAVFENKICPLDKQLSSNNPEYAGNSLEPQVPKCDNLEDWTISRHN